MSEPRMTLTYYNTDDGVWLDCSCGDSVHLGFHGTVADAVKAEREHMEQKHTVVSFEEPQ